MVGSLGANATAAIGLVASTTWLFGGLCIAMVTGFSVQIAHLIGGGRRAEAQSVVRQGLMAALLWGALLSLAGVFISGGLPRWLGGAADVCPDSSRYFFIYAPEWPARSAAAPGPSARPEWARPRAPATGSNPVPLSYALASFGLISPQYTSGRGPWQGIFQILSTSGGHRRNPMDPAQGRLERFLVKDEGKKQVAVYRRPVPGGKSAVTGYRTLGGIRGNISPQTPPAPPGRPGPGGS